MQNYTKYYSYNQIIEKFDVLVMTEQEYLQNKDKLDNPQRIVLVNRAGGTKRPTTRQLLLDFIKEQRAFNSKVQKQFRAINDQFKAHGWTK